MEPNIIPADIVEPIEGAQSYKKSQSSSNLMSQKENDDAATLKKATRWLVIFGAAMFGAVFLMSAAFTMHSEYWVVELAREHFAATVGLPFAALAALCLVIILEISSGTIQIKGLGFEFKGAGGPLVMWIFCFLSIASAIKLLW